MKLRNTTNCDECCKGKRISELDEKVDIQGTEYIPYQEGDDNGKFSLGSLKDYLIKLIEEYLINNGIIREDWVQSEPAYKLLATLPELIADRACKDEFGNNINDTYLTRKSVKEYIGSIFEDLFTENPPKILDGYITVDMLSDAVLQLLNSGGAITNFPDDEDLTVKDGKLKFKDKVYDPNNYSGMGRTILRKNMVDGVNVLTQEMMSEPNVIYVIQYDYDLRGETIVVPDNSILWYLGGSLNNGHITSYDEDRLIIWGNLNGDIEIDIDVSLVGAPADEEDITTESGVLKFKDKEYDTASFSGLGRKYLRKNILNGKNILTQEMINSANTRYIIQYDYDLNGEEITIPEGCILDFQGGSISNGKIVCNNTIINKCYYHIFINLNIEGTLKIDGWYPEWFGAIPYKKDVLNKITSSLSIIGELEVSNDAFIRINDALVNTNIHTVLLSNLYYVTKEISIKITPNYNSGVNIIGIGTDTGFIAYINDNSASVLSINKDSTTISQSDYLSNFAVYVTNNSNLDSAILLYEVIRSTCSDVKVFGGYANFKKGIYHVHSVVNQNVFQNVFDRCVGMNTTTGGGIHYSQDTYQPTLQAITKCVLMGLGGAGIESEPTPITGGGFGGIIIGNELEGNAKGAIALSSINNLSVRNNYFEVADFSVITNYFENVPPAIFTFGIITGASGSNYITNIYNLDVSNNQIGGARGSIDYAIIISSPTAGGRTFCVDINNNIINQSTSPNVGCKYITRIQYGESINISNNYIRSDYEGVNTNFPVEVVGNNGNAYYSYKGNVISFDSNYGYSYSKGLGILRTNAFITATNYPYITPTRAGIHPQLSTGDFILLETNNTIYKVIHGGVLHYNTNASFTEGSNVVVCSGATWDWQVGDTVNSDYINNGTATITDISGTNFTLSEKATSTINDWLTDAVAIPYELSSIVRIAGTTSNRPNYRYTKIPAGFQYFDTTLNRPIFYTGSKWVDATGADV